MNHRWYAFTDIQCEAGRAALFADIEKHAADLARADVAVIVYGCTAGSMVSPVTSLTDFIAKKFRIKALITAQATVDALTMLQVKKPSVAIRRRIYTRNGS